MRKIFTFLFVALMSASMFADPNILTPTISGDLSFTESTTVTMECASPNSDIYYTTDGVTDPRCDCAAAPEYKQPITITETTIIKAAAYDGNDWSAVAEVTFTKVPAPADPNREYFSLDPSAWTWGYYSTSEAVAGGIKTTVYSDFGALSMGWDPSRDLSGWDKIVFEVSNMDGCEGEWWKLKAYLRDESDSEGKQMEGFLGLDAPDNELNYLVIDLHQQVEGFDLTKARVLAVQCEPTGGTFTISSAYLLKEEAPAKYYIVGNMTNWEVNDAYEMSFNEFAEAEEYSFRMHLTTDNQFKVLKVEGENRTWYPDGMGNNYGEHGEITGEANYNIYFRPNADGDEAWFYNLILVERRIVIEPVVFSVKVPDNGKPESIEIVGDFGEGWENGVVLEPNGGWYMTDALFADEYDEFKIRGAGSWDNEIYVRTETGWTVSQNFRFGALWKEGTRDEAPVRVIELDLSGENYGWKQSVQSIDNINLKSENHKLIVDGVIYIVRDGKLFNAQGAQVR